MILIRRVFRHVLAYGGSRAGATAEPIRRQAENRASPSRTVGAARMHNVRTRLHARLTSSGAQANNSGDNLRRPVYLKCRRRNWEDAAGTRLRFCRRKYYHIAGRVSGIRGSGRIVCSKRLNGIPSGGGVETPSRISCPLHGTPGTPDKRGNAKADPRSIDRASGIWKIFFTFWAPDGTLVEQRKTCWGRF